MQTDVDLSKSSSSAAFPYSSPTCHNLGPYANGYTPTGDQCQYCVQYPDGSASAGTYISDVLTLNPAKPVSAIAEFRFGCSHALLRPGSFSNKTYGIMALGHGAQSLPTQTTPSTPMLRSKAAPMLYLVRLVAIEVAGKRLPVPPAVFAAGAVMGSRTIVTRLPPTAYMALRAAFVVEMCAYRAAAPKEHLDTCYDFSPAPGGGVKLPKITLVFDGPGAAMELDPSEVLLDGCLAFAPNTDGLMTAWL